MGDMKPSLVVIGGSAGGFEAVARILDGLNEAMILPIAVVLHLPEDFPFDVAQAFHPVGRRLVEVEDKTPVREREVYVAPPGYHLLLERDGRSFALSQDEKVHFARPSIDVFFKSVAEACGNSTVAVLLTGANEDGAEGLKAIKDRGGKTIVEDPGTAQVPVMPRAALALGPADHVANLDGIVRAIESMAMGSGKAW